MAAALVVTNVPSVDKALQCAAFLNSKNAMFTVTRNVAIGKFVYMCIGDDSVKPEEIALNGIARRELGVSIGDIVNIKPFENDPHDADQCVATAGIDYCYLDNVDHGAFAEGFLEALFVDKFGDRYLTVGQSFILSTVRGIMVKFTVTSLTGAVFNQTNYDDVPIFFPKDAMKHGVCPKISRIKMRAVTQNDK